MLPAFLSDFSKSIEPGPDTPSAAQILLGAMLL